MRFIGDIHGAFNDYANFYTVGADESIQVGDFGIGFGSDFWHSKIEDWQIQNPKHQFIRGNHDDPEKCATMPGYIKDGYVKDDMMFVGGAYSIDKHIRLANDWPWWENEQLSYREFEQIMDIYSVVKPNIMITHDCPQFAARHLFFDSGLCRGKQEPTITGQALEAMFRIHQPKLWIFGHYHIPMDRRLANTTFICVADNNYADINLEDFR